MIQVWVASIGERQGGGSVLGVYITLEAAKAALDKKKSEWDDTTWEEWVIKNPVLYRYDNGCEYHAIQLFDVE